MFSKLLSNLRKAFSSKGSHTVQTFTAQDSFPLEDWRKLSNDNKLAVLVIATFGTCTEKDFNQMYDSVLEFASLPDEAFEQFSAQVLSLTGYMIIGDMYVRVNPNMLSRENFKKFSSLNSE